LLNYQRLSSRIQSWSKLNQIDRNQTCQTSWVSWWRFPLRHSFPHLEDHISKTPSRHSPPNYPFYCQSYSQVSTASFILAPFVISTRDIKNLFRHLWNKPTRSVLLPAFYKKNAFVSLVLIFYEYVVRCFISSDLILGSNM
jgi:hypothetical protein